MILIADTLGEMDDCQRLFENLHPLCTNDTRIVIVYYSHLWHPALKLAETLRLKMPQPPQNVLSADDIKCLLELADFEPVKSEKRTLSPIRLLGLGRLVNQFIAPFPLVRELCLRHYTVCRSLRHLNKALQSVTVVVPARNERANIEAAVRRIPWFTENLEIIFVEGHSADGTWDEIQRVVAAYPVFRNSAAPSVADDPGAINWRLAQNARLDRKGFDPRRPSIYARRSRLVYPDSSW